MIKCELCGSEFNNYNGLSKHLNAKHKDVTKQEYYDQFLSDGNDGKCDVCDSPTRFLNLVKGYGLKCSVSCAISKPLGYKYIHDGYVKIKTEEGWVYEHRYLMEQKLNRKLSPSEVIHHIDEIRHHNDLDNLELTNNSDHMKMHPETILKAARTISPDRSIKQWETRRKNDPDNESAKRGVKTRLKNNSEEDLKEVYTKGWETRRKNDPDNDSFKRGVETRKEHYPNGECYDHLRGREVSEETKRKQSEYNKNHKKTMCPYCGQFCKTNNPILNHFDNCKQNPKNKDI